VAAVGCEPGTGELGFVSLDARERVVARRRNTSSDSDRLIVEHLRGLQEPARSDHVGCHPRCEDRCIKLPMDETQRVLIQQSFGRLSAWTSSVGTSMTVDAGSSLVTASTAFVTAGSGMVVSAGFDSRRLAALRSARVGSQLVASAQCCIGRGSWSSTSSPSS
jgi:hypothetical protein